MLFYGLTTNGIFTNVIKSCSVPSELPGKKWNQICCVYCKVPFNSVPGSIPSRVLVFKYVYGPISVTVGFPPCSISSGFVTLKK